MTHARIAHRYAKALFQAALDAGVEDDLSGDVEGLFAIVSESPRLRRFLLSPQVPIADKHTLVEKVLDGRAQRLLVDLLHLLIDKKRIVFLVDIVEAFRDVYRKNKGVTAVKAITAVPLAEDQRRRLMGILKARTHNTISLAEVVDPDILGGMILMVDDSVVDGSVRHQLEVLRRRLRETRVVRAGEAQADQAP
jgi:F-type H+-transporting ATPase subunit delta